MASSVVSLPAEGQVPNDFFIADRLRGIPLVSMSKSWRDSKSTTTSTTTMSTTTTTTTTLTSEPNKMLNRTSQVGKRDASSVLFADTHGRRIQNQGEILFKQTGSTSSVAQLVKSTTKRPQQQQQQQQKITTTRRPRVIRTTTTTTRRPTTTSTRRTTTTTTRRQQHLAKMLIRANQHQVVTSGSTTTSVRPNTETRSVESHASGRTGSNLDQLIEPISSHKMTTLEAMSGTVGSFIASTLPLLSTTPTTTGMTSSTTIDQPSSTTTIVSTTTADTGQAAAQERFDRHSTTLTRSMQTLTTLPVNQRRTQPNLVPVPRGFGSGSTTSYSAASGGGGGRFATNDPRNGYAGENWYLFKRTDGDLSAFEILVLVANILIVATIILVILINWIRVFKRKRSPPPPPPQAQQGQLTPAEMATNDRASKMSLISSGGASQVTSSMTTSAPDAQTTTTITTATTSSVANVAANQQQQQQQQPPQPQPPPQQLPIGQQVQAKASEMIDKAKGELAQGLVGASQRIVSEFNSASANVANKAMAIVQPTENNTNNSSSYRAKDLTVKPDDLTVDKLKEELLLAGQQRPAISRSVSDLSGGVPATDRQVELKKKKSADDMSKPVATAITNTTPDRVTALEELFTGTKKEIEMQKDEEATRKMKMKRKQQQQQQQQQETGLHSSNSLESIDLPNNLVESIKRTAPSTLRAQVDETLTPSPNLLIGETSKKTTQQQQNIKSAPLPAEQVIKAEINTAGAPPMPPTTKQEDQSSVDRPENPMSRAMGDISEEKPLAQSNAMNKSRDKQPAAAAPPPAKAAPTPAAAPTPKAQQAQKKMATNLPPAARAPETKLEADSSSKISQEALQPAIMEKQPRPTAEVLNHQVVVNKLDKRKTNLEIVDLRDESVTGKMRTKQDGKQLQADDAADNSGTSWISMDGVAVVQPSGSSAPMTPAAAAALQQQQQQQQGSSAQPAAIASSMSPSEIIESRFNVDYKSKARKAAGQPSQAGQQQHQDSVDSKQEEYVFNNIENELELDNKMKNRKYFVYIVNDGHFTAKKECIARIELPPKRRITLAELRQLISSSQDISLSSLRRNRFKFVTETYRLLNENEDAAVLHQVYPTQGVFLKLNVNEQENQSYAFKGGRSTRLSSGAGASSTSASGVAGGGGGGPSSLSQTTIASRRRAANVRSNATRSRAGGNGGGDLPAIEVNQYGQSSGYGAPRASSVGQRGRGRVGPGGGAYARSKSSVQMGRGGGGGGRVSTGMRRGVSSNNVNDDDGGGGGLPPLGTSNYNAGGRRGPVATNKRGRGGGASNSRSPGVTSKSQTIGEAASDLGANMVAGAKKLFSSTFHR